MMKARSNVNCLGCGTPIKVEATYDPAGKEGIRLDREDGEGLCVKGAFSSTLGKVVEGHVILRCSNCGLQNQITLLLN